MDINETRIIAFLNQLPVGTLITLAGVAGALFALVTNQITYLEFSVAIGASGIGGGAIGAARNGAGHGKGVLVRIVKERAAPQPTATTTETPGDGAEEHWVK